MNDPGYSIHAAVLSARECDYLRDALASSRMARGRAGARHLMTHSAVAQLVHDERLVARARDYVGVGATPFRATLFEKSGQSNWLVIWHQDTALPLEARIESDDWGPWSRKGGVIYAHAPTWALSRIVALRVHLDASSAENGPLRVIAGSHTRGVLRDEEVFALAHERSSEECIVDRGGVLAMRPLLIHSSSKGRNGQPRRVLHIEYADSLDLAAGVRLAVA